MVYCGMDTLTNAARTHTVPPTLETLHAIRQEFEQRVVDKALLVELYRDYAQVPDTEDFVKRAVMLFPRLNCGLASLYMQHRFGTGVITQGKYGNERHTFLMLGDLVADLTADQYGGPPVYLGPLQAPWHKSGTTNVLHT